MKREVSDRKDYETVLDAFLSGVGVDEMPFTKESVEGVLRDALRDNLKEDKSLKLKSFQFGELKFHIDDNA
jgi:hypothetical protein